MGALMSHPGGARHEARLLRRLRDAGWAVGQTAGWSEEEAHEVLAWLCGSGLQGRSLVLAAVTLEVLAANQPATVRQAMYLVVSAGFLPDTGSQSYDKIQRLLVMLRRAGVVPYGWIVDNVRSMIRPSSWAGLQEFTGTVRDCYRKDFWASLPEVVEVVVEKDTIAGPLSVVTEEFDVPLYPLRGFSSETFAWTIGNRWRDIQKPINAVFVGDWDPAGVALEEDVRVKLREFCGRDFGWTRLAVRPDHFGVFGIRPLAPKKGDTRAAAFVRTHGPACAEVEAVPAEALRRMLRAQIESYIPQDQWAKLREVERREQETWRQVMDKVHAPSSKKAGVR